METAKIKVTRAKAEEIADFYSAQVIEDPSRPYDYFQVTSPDGIQIRAYRTGNPDVFTVVFTGGEKAVLEAQIFESDREGIEVSGPHSFSDVGEQIGSDEVGVGDFFGPMVVTAVYFLPSQLPTFERLGVRDSKKLTDARMEILGRKLCRTFKHVTVSCSARKLSDYVDRGYSNHWVLAKLHDLAQRKLIEKYGIPEDVVCYVDQFEAEYLYRRHAGENMVTNPVIFATKGESRYPAVAVASVIARYEFLKLWDRMEKDLGVTIPKGASHEVLRTYQEISKTLGRSRANRYVKRFFSYYEPE